VARGDKSKYSSKQRRMAEHIEQGYKKRGASTNKAERIAWATVNKEYGGGTKGGGGSNRKRSRTSERKGGRRGGSR
jgi:hypothetical protein